MLMAFAALDANPDGTPRSVTVPPWKATACEGPKLAVPLLPTISPLLLIAAALLEAPPGRTPRSVMTPFCQTNAWDCPLEFAEEPTICAELLMALAVAPI